MLRGVRQRNEKICRNSLNFRYYYLFRLFTWIQSKLAEINEKMWKCKFCTTILYLWDGTLNFEYLLKVSRWRFTWEYPMECYWFSVGLAPLYPFFHSLGWVCFKNRKLEKTSDNNRNYRTLIMKYLEHQKHYLCFCKISLQRKRAVELSTATKNTCCWALAHAITKLFRFTAGPCTTENQSMNNSCYQSPVATRPCALKPLAMP